ncbi:unnamed protein product [Arctia plantaginis]|uniref:Major facilitator superfamily (MFS) profile domain-containing protein n=1 Tax=Arctia plantaginis TaxID=874455 RepID=A0A8S1B624_ARCPL|nr:unnamed protein product [Arctia plantaginis]
MNNAENEDPETEIIGKVTLDTIFVKEIGQFGKFQLKTVCLAAIIAIFASWGATEYVFTTARINTRCVIPECEGARREWSPPWLPNAVPAVGSGLFDNCKRFANTTAMLQRMESEECPSTLFDTKTVEYCEKFVYENTDSVAYDFDLACDEWSRSLIGTIRTLGTFIALPITGYVSDRWGRRVALTINAFNTGWLGLIRFWTNTYMGFMLFEFLEAVFGSGGFSSIYILVMELMGPEYRVIGSASIDTFFAIGQVLMGLIAWGVPNWRYLTLILYVPQLFTILYFWLISESVRWYMSKGRFDDSEALLKKVAKTNGTLLSEKSLKSLRDTSLEEERNKRLEEEMVGQEPWLIVKVFQHKRVLLRCIVSPVWWITTTFIYYGLSINAVNMSGNKYLNFVAVAAVEIPGFWTAVFLMGKIGRKPVLIGAFWICAACQIAYIFMPPDLYAVSLTVYLIAKFSIAMVMSSVYIYTMELYPTKHRHSLFAYSSMIGRIGSMIAPLTPAFGAQWFANLPFVLFASFALVSGALIFLTPETLGTKLPDTFEEASDIGLKNSIRK